MLTTNQINNMQHRVNAMLRLAKLHQDNRPPGTKPNADNLKYWHERCKELGAVWSNQRTEFMLGVADFKHSLNRQVRNG